VHPSVPGAQVVSDSHIQPALGAIEHLLFADKALSVAAMRGMSAWLEVCELSFQWCTKYQCQISKVSSVKQEAGAHCLQVFCSYH
jgi:hypothetical protein